jgi:hypothetical protein
VSERIPYKSPVAVSVGRVRSLSVSLACLSGGTVLGDDGRGRSVVGADVRELLSGAVPGVVVDDRDGEHAVRPGEPPRLVVIDQHHGLRGEVAHVFDRLQIQIEHRSERAVLLMADLSGVLHRRVDADLRRERRDAERRRHRVRVGVRVHQHRDLLLVGEEPSEPDPCRPANPEQEVPPCERDERDDDRDRRQLRVLSNERLRLREPLVGRAQAPHMSSGLPPPT